MPDKDKNINPTDESGVNIDELLNPFAACFKCPKKALDICPIIKSKPINMRVTEPNKCIMEQMDEQQLASIAVQIINHLSLMDLEKTRLKRELDLVNEVLSRKGRIWRPA